MEESFQYIKLDNIWEQCHFRSCSIKIVPYWLPTSATRLLHSRHRELTSRCLKASNISYPNEENRYMMKYLSLHPKYGILLVYLTSLNGKKAKWLTLHNMRNLKNTTIQLKTMITNRKRTNKVGITLMTNLSKRKFRSKIKNGN